MPLSALTTWSWSVDYAQALRCTAGSGSKVSWHTAGVSSGTSAKHSAPLCLGTFVLDSFPCWEASLLPALDDMATNLFAFPGHDTCSSAPPVFSKACTNIASLGAATYECDGCAGLGTGERKPGSPWIPLSRAALPWEEWGSTLVSFAPGVCDHAADLAASLHLPVYGRADQPQHHQPGSIIPPLPGS